MHTPGLRVSIAPELTARSPKAAGVQKVSRLALVLLVAWLACSIALGGLLLAAHAPLPVPSASDARTHAAFAELLQGRRGWRVAHVLYRSCACSQRTLEHLRSARRDAGVHELVLLVEDGAAPNPEDQQLRERGLEVVVIDRETLVRRFGLEAAPVLVVLRPDDSVAYLGGYTRSKQGPVFEHERIVAGLRAEQSTGTLPVFGCATSARLSSLIDPLGLRKW